MRLTCDSGEFFYDGESIGDTFDFECSIMKGKKGPEGREERKALRLAKKRNEVERGQWRQTPECKRVTPLVEDKETSKSQRKKNKEVEGIDFGESYSMSHVLLIIFRFDICTYSWWY